MENFLKKTGFTSIVTSLVFAIIGIILITNPESTMRVLSYILGTIFIIAGGIKTINYFISKGNYDFYNYELIYGIIAIILGAITIFYSATIRYSI